MALNNPAYFSLKMTTRIIVSLTSFREIFLSIVSS